MQIIRNKSRNRSKVTAITFVLILIAATLVTFVPVTLGQLKIETEGNVVVQPAKTNYPVGVNQPVRVMGVVYPVGYVIDLTFTFTKPDGSTEVIVKTSNRVSEAQFDYVCDQVGEWEVAIYWSGDATHEAAGTPQYGALRYRWMVQQEPTPAFGKQKTYSYASTVPKKLLGLGQYIYIVGWVTPPRSLFGAVFLDYKFSITKPNGTTDTIVKDSNSEASTSFGYLCDQIGEWSVRLDYDGDQLHEAAISAPAWTWTVQQEAVPTIQNQPLPDYPWTYPVSAEYYEWFQITGSWIGDSYNDARTNFNPYSKGPDTPHVLWKKPMIGAGIFGELGHSGIYDEVNPVPVAAFGRMFFRKTGGYGDTLHPIVVCYDQFTGEVIWEVDLPTDPDEPGSGGELYVEIVSWVKVDPKLGVRPDDATSIWCVGGGGVWELNLITGETLYYNSQLGSGTFHEGAIYFTNYPESGTMTKWDTRAKAIVWSKPIPSPDFIWNDVIVDGSQSTGGIPYGQQLRSWSTETGELVASGPFIEFYSTESPGRTCVEYDQWYFHSSTTLASHAVNVYTGELVWSTEPNEAPWGVFGSYVTAAAYGNYYQGTWDGYLSCYDAETGATQWRTYLGDNPDTAMGQNVPWGQPIIADGKVYIASSEHTAPVPVPRGNALYCLDAHTGNLIWRMDGWMYERAGGGISSGVLFVSNQYDGALYAFGKGPSETTVSIQQDVIAKGASVLIKGTVTDQSAGAKGTPAIADEDMSKWTAYLYMNKPMPTDVTGVSVMLQAMRSDGSIIDIGFATSDIMGNYEYLWTPPDEDTYKILATFLGSGSYWMSSAGTALGVTAAPSPGGPIEPEPTAGLGITEIAIIAAVVVACIIGVAAFWALKKQRK